ncbi:hypothetical protein EVAR_68969_1 [Eumeta japonica]|uniref:Uncharacterized protein n=1 Tax=Eumeta variegata TaxID=151549 RepID=A0A4C2A7Z7_EUMVA|nr:hypothetical protein EVAR_68969_1 [Eumeta japonica]
MTSKYRSIRSGVGAEAGLRRPRLRRSARCSLQGRGSVLRGLLTAEKYDVVIPGVLNQNKIPSQHPRKVVKRCNSSVDLYSDSISNCPCADGVSATLTRVGPRPRAGPPLTCLQPTTSSTVLARQARMTSGRPGRGGAWQQAARGGATSPPDALAQTSWLHRSRPPRFRPAPRLHRRATLKIHLQYCITFTSSQTRGAAAVAEFGRFCRGASPGRARLERAHEELRARAFAPINN